jgi:hypothetical protein
MPPPQVKSVISWKLLYVAFLGSGERRRVDWFCGGEGQVVYTGRVSPRHCSSVGARITVESGFSRSADRWDKPPRSPFVP